MKVSDLKRIIQDLPDDLEIYTMRGDEYGDDYYPTECYEITVGEVETYNKNDANLVKTPTGRLKKSGRRYGDPFYFKQALIIT